MNPSKALGPDGVHALFFQKYWDIVGQETSRICLEVLNEKKDMIPLNKTSISLIPKVNKPMRMEEFRQRCNVIYKIIAKVLVNRLKKVLDSVISPSQSTSFQGGL